MTTTTSIRLLAILTGWALLTMSVIAQQQTQAVTAADYARAEKMLAQNLNGLVVGGSVAPGWLPDERFWYRTALRNGTSQVILVDPIKRTRTVCSEAIPNCKGLGNNSAPLAS